MINSWLIFLATPSSMKKSASSFVIQYERFYRQVIQLYPKLDFPNEEFLRNIKNQTLLYETLFADKALKYKPPTTYQIRILKELLRRIEDSISDWDKDVCF